MVGGNDDDGRDDYVSTMMKRRAVRIRPRRLVRILRSAWRRSDEVVVFVTNPDHTSYLVRLPHWVAWETGVQDIIQHLPEVSRPVAGDNLHVTFEIVGRPAHHVVDDEEEEGEVEEWGHQLDLVPTGRPVPAEIPIRQTLVVKPSFNEDGASDSLLEAFVSSMVNPPFEVVQSGSDGSSLWLVQEGGEGCGMFAPLHSLLGAKFALSRGVDLSEAVATVDITSTESVLSVLHTHRDFSFDLLASGVHDNVREDARFISSFLCRRGGTVSKEIPVKDTSNLFMSLVQKIPLSQLRVLGVDGRPVGISLQTRLDELQDPVYVRQTGRTCMSNVLERHEMLQLVFKEEPDPVLQQATSAQHDQSDQCLVVLATFAFNEDGTIRRIEDNPMVGQHRTFQAASIARYCFEPAIPRLIEPIPKPSPCLTRLRILRAMMIAQNLKSFRKKKPEGLLDLVDITLMVQRMNQIMDEARAELARAAQEGEVSDITQATMESHESPLRWIERFSPQILRQLLRHLDRWRLKRGRNVCEILRAATEGTETKVPQELLVDALQLAEKHMALFPGQNRQRET